MGIRKKRRRFKYWQPCPRCGDIKRYYFKDATRRWKPYSVSCAYCHFRSAPAFTKFGARRKWNKATSIVEVRKVGKK